MPDGCTSTVLILEGPGDKEAVPTIIREILYQNDVYDLVVQPHPIINQNIPKLWRPGELERFASYGLRREADSLLIILDADESCPKDVALDFGKRLKALDVAKKVGIAILRSEFEVFFLFSLLSIANRYTDYGWKLEEWNPDQDFETVVGAKGLLTRLMKRGRSYKETRDQAKFCSALDFDILREQSRSFRHLESMLIWLVRDSEAHDNIYPII